MPAVDERQLIRQAQDGDHEAFRLLVEQYMRHAYNVAFSFVNDHDDADDIAQEAFVRVHRSLRSFRGDAEFTTWLHRIVMNLSFDRLKQKRKRATMEVTGQDLSALVSPGPGGDLDLRMNIERALHELPTAQRAVVILRHLDGLSTKQVSEILRCSEGTVKTHLHRGLKKMKSLLNYLREA